MRFQSGSDANYKRYDRGDQEGVIILVIPERDHKRNQHHHPEKSQYRAYEIDDGIIIHVRSVSLTPYRSCGIMRFSNFNISSVSPGSFSFMMIAVVCGLYAIAMPVSIPVLAIPLFKDAVVSMSCIRLVVWIFIS